MSSQNTKILFVLPDVNSFHKLEIHFGLGYLSAVLKQNGFFDIKFFSVTSLGDYQPLLDLVVDYQPAVVGFTSVETQFINVINISQKIRQLKEDCVIVCGGPLPTIFPECVIDAPHLDGVFIGECEEAFLKFVNLIAGKGDFRATENFCFYDRTTKQVVKNPTFPIQMDLDKFGPPDREIFDYQRVIDSYGAAPFMFNRGCPYNCAFCSNHAIAKVYGRLSNSIRRRSVASCIKELEDVGNQYSFDSVHIWDDLFTLDRRWLFQFLDEYRTKINKPFMCTTRSNLCDDELFMRLKEAGCYRVHMSLESGNDFIRNRIMNRKISRETIVRSFELANKYKIEVSATSVIGLPFETEEMIKDTINLLGQLKVTSPGVNVFYPYKGTQLRTLCEDYKLIAPKHEYDTCERRESILDSPHIGKERLNYYFESFERLVRKAEGFWPGLKYQTKASLKKLIPDSYRARLRMLLARRKTKAMALNSK